MRKEKTRKLLGSVDMFNTLLPFSFLQHVRQLVSSKRHVIIIIIHWLVHAYGILAVTLVQDPTVHGPLFTLVLAPVLFYLGTHSFTDPSKFKTT